MRLSFAGEIKFVVSFLIVRRISFYGLQLEYALEASSNYIAGKERMEVVVEEKKLKEFIDIDIPTYAQDLVEWRKCVAKERMIILEGVGDHIVLNLHRKDTPYATWKALIDLFQNNSDHRKLALKG